jgi:hypothetical protein
VKIAIRPEDVELVLAQDCDGPNLVLARIRAAVFLGDHYQLSVVLPNGASLQLHAPRADAAWEGDQQVGVYLPSDGVTLWPA